VIGNWPVRSVAILLWASVMAEKTRLVLALGRSDGGVRSADARGRMAYVDRMFWRCWCMCPWTVAMDLGRCLRTRSAVSPGQVAKWPRSIAWIHVEGMV
jgi:hypothetical protein